jgi:hypothetical protein
MLHEYRREPDPAFARDLRDRLRRQERPKRLSARAGGLLFAGAAAALLIIVFAVPSVGVYAQSVLDVFRVKRFAAVQFTESHRQILDSLEKDRLMIFDKEEVTQEPGPSRGVASREAAGDEAGFKVRAPGFLPAGFKADSVFVQGAGAVRFAASEAKLRALLDRLDLKSVKVPPGLDGGWVEVKKPPIVLQRFVGGKDQKRRAILLQANSPEVSMPAGWDLAVLGEIGLRILGLDEGEAKRVAKATDWKSTLLVPIPMNAASFRQVTVRGRPALLIMEADRKQDREAAMLMWSDGDRIFCLRGSMSSRDLMQMAESI